MGSTPTDYYAAYGPKGHQCVATPYFVLALIAACLEEVAFGFRVSDYAHENVHEYVGRSLEVRRAVRVYLKLDGRLALPISVA